MKLHHIAIWTFRLEELKEFYVRFLVPCRSAAMRVSR